MPLQHHVLREEPIGETLRLCGVAVQIFENYEFPEENILGTGIVTTCFI